MLDALTAFAGPMVALLAFACSQPQEPGALPARSPAALADFDDDGRPYGPFVDLALSERHECGLRASGHVQCWKGGGAIPDLHWVDIDGSGEGLCMLSETDDYGWAVIKCLTPEGSEAVDVGPGFPRGLRVGAGTLGWCVLTDTGVQCSTALELVRTDLAGMAAGRDRFCVWDQAGVVRCVGMSAPYSFPDRLKAMDLSLSPGGCAVRTDGVAQCFGTFYATPPLERFDRIWSSVGHRCGRTEDRRVRCWGLNTDHPPPEGAWSEVSMVGDAGCGVRQDGEIRCWHMPP